jgi:hypothetical protein
MMAISLARPFRFKKGRTFESSVCKTGEQRRKFKEVADFTGFQDLVEHSGLAGASGMT